MVTIGIGSHFGKDMTWVQNLSITRFGFADGMVVWKSGCPEICRGEVWRLISPMLLHFGFPHLLGNGLALWLFGTQFEWRYGRVRFMAFLFTAGLTCNVIVYELRGPYFGGISGALLAMFGFLVWRANVQHDPRLKMEWPIIVSMLVFVVADFLGFIKRSSPTAHLATLAFGVVLALLIPLQKASATQSS